MVNPTATFHYYHLIRVQEMKTRMETQYSFPKKKKKTEAPSLVVVLCLSIAANQINMGGWGRKCKLSLLAIVSTVLDLKCRLSRSQEECLPRPTASQEMLRLLLEGN